MKLEQRYEGKAKKVYATENPLEYVVEYKDDATAFNGVKRAQIQGKGEINNAITAHLFPLLERAGVPTHFLEKLSDREQRVRAVTIIPVEVIVRNVAAGSFAKRLGLEEGTPLARPVVEYCYKSDALGDPLINSDTAVALGWASEADLKRIRELALKVRDFLVPYFEQRGIRLVDFKLEFGRTPDGTIVLADEISPDTCRFWDAETNEKLDKDRFRRDLGGVEDAYAEMLRRVTGEGVRD
ncbi:phosphoribosylaminoimidazolesuccinocarboxamide synthase [Deinococcus metallilatus]|uniref:Phosphoribosylaminoimidazole-succinocarboxamide synthase n=1 Tax=Deinococcus metallilatus TaxID=1211322 RepID=A0AAJ5F5Y0_9DEIO|nr:phosphoribosylaminoimidazolesuccinocarboxamide synthase [Deinococcus metallilatus]MBB5294533.1 phosphoribosylaminoimidazole-succinocarboxamide synthase [Deinococcus metallilatus]QBY07579.1 phosphoribosylaminoimidazolesuccinocarboxamide synthase [Deinococcus metallilatus]RXJ13995.1 phosphoribosylaminoimidazolesuccinocarboxamide synthase [Deinococcus metallilatus]TLK29960.1 phosphoribosylaminoimidazolesuccinocarboxamide synthase [Deinococcus metallilatus]GMA15747.1 phosphoribosylaminoimidazol